MCTKLRMKQKTNRWCKRKLSYCTKKEAVILVGILVRIINERMSTTIMITQWTPKERRQVPEDYDGPRKNRK